MWVKSQNKNWLVNLDRTNAARVVDTAGGLYEFHIYADDTNLGGYRTEERARLAVEKLETEITNSGNDRTHIFHMPKDEELEGGAKAGGEETCGS